jgi:hypothetical protein
MGNSARKSGKLKKKSERAVYIFARSLKLAGRAGFLSDGKLPLCHWGMLVSKYNKDELKKRFERLDPSKAESWGTFIELNRNPENKITHNMIRNFSAEEWYNEWKFISMVFIGETELLDVTLCEEGTKFSPTRC